MHKSVLETLEILTSDISETYDGATENTTLHANPKINLATKSCAIEVAEAVSIQPKRLGNADSSNVRFIPILSVDNAHINGPGKSHSNVSIIYNLEEV